MAVKKSALYSKLWDSCNTLRSKGGMDATQYKDYVLIILFMKVITDKYYKKKNSIITVPDDANFNTMIDLKNKTNIGEKFNEILKKIAEENDLENVIDVVDFNDDTKLGKGKDKIDALTGLISIFQDPELDFSNNRADDDDILGDAYEYLMKKFASEAGKSKGQFYTPSEVSRVMAKVIGINNTKKSQIYVYDMACGSGSLLLKAGAEAPSNVKVNLYGQEKDNSTAGLSVMNMFLHGNPTAVIKSDNTLTKPQFIENGRLKTFDYCVANPPFSVKKWSSGMEKQYDRFTLGFPSDGCADYAFLLHMLTSMDPDNGRGAIILPHGVLFRGGQEAAIRERLIKNGYIEGIISLPPNLFYGTGISACILILDKKNAANRKNIFIIDAGKDYVKDGNKNKLRERDIKKIVDTYINKTEIPHYSSMVEIEAIEQEKYNLNIPRYIEPINNDDIQDVSSHLLGGIPEYNLNKLNDYWMIAPSLKNSLFKSNLREGYYDLKVSKDTVKQLIEESDEIRTYESEIDTRFKKWSNTSKSTLVNINNESKIKELINFLSNEMLDVFKGDRLIQEYDAYEFLMQFYNETMKDDFHYIVENGWYPKIVYELDKNGKPKLNVFDSDLLPKKYIIARYFNDLQIDLEKSESELKKLESDFEELVGENTGDEMIFKEDDKTGEKAIKDKIKIEDEENIIILNELLNNLKEQKVIKKIIKDKQLNINNLIKNKYEELDEEKIKDIIVNDKWFSGIYNLFENHMMSLKTFLRDYIIKIVNNYERTLSDISSRQNEVEKIINRYLNKENNISINTILNGEIEFEGLDNDYIETTIGNICTSISKGSGLAKEDITSDGKYKCILYGELFTTYDEVIKDVESYTNVKTNILSKKGDILIPGSTTTVGRDLAKASVIALDDVLLGGDINILRIKENYDPKYIAYLFTNALQDEVEKVAQGTTIIHLYGKSISNIKIKIPKEKKVQEKISELLELMSENIELIELKQEKYNLIKLGSMSNILG